MKTYLGTAPDSWGVWFPKDARQVPWQRYLDEVQQIGYRYTELGPYGYMPTDPQELRDELQRRNLTCVSSMMVGNLTRANAVDKLRAEFDASCRLLTKLNAKFMGIIEECYTDLFTGDRVTVPELGATEWSALIRSVEILGKIAAEEHGLTLLYHHHADTHVEYERQIVRLLNDTSPEYTSLVLDTGHLAYRDGDSAAFMAAHHERIPYIHVKSVDHAIRDRMKVEQMPFATAVANDLFCEPSVGAVDFKAFRTTLKTIDFEGYVIVEQDMYPAPFDKPFPIAKRTHEYLRRLGFGEN